CSVCCFPSRRGLGIVETFTLTARGKTMKRLLLVDDDDAILESLQMLLEGTYHLALARHGREALDRLAEQPFDAILLDLMMPVMDGASLVRELQARGIEVP